jgi:hypothetical protein
MALTYFATCGSRARAELCGHSVELTDWVLCPLGNSKTPRNSQESCKNTQHAKRHKNKRFEREISGCAGSESLCRAHDGLERLSEKRLRVRQLRSAKTACPHSVSSFHDISK